MCVCVCVWLGITMEFMQIENLWISSRISGYVGSRYLQHPCIIFTLCGGPLVNCSIFQQTGTEQEVEPNVIQGTSLNFHYGQQYCQIVFP